MRILSTSQPRTVNRSPPLPGLRTLCLAYKDLGKADAPEDWDDAAPEPFESGLVCLGIVGIQVR